MAAASWNPTCFVRYVKTIATSTSPAIVVTDAGEAYLKAINNPVGPHALVRELVGTRLAGWLGLETLDFAIMPVRDVDEIPLAKGATAAVGPAFVTRRVAGGIQWGGDPETLQTLYNPEAIPRLVIFDTWTRNPDRHPPAGTERRVRPDNVFLSPEGAPPRQSRLLAMDHTECFWGRRDLGRDVAHIDAIQDERIFGLFPEFLPHLSFKEVNSTAAHLGTVPLSFVREVVATIPLAWAVPAEVRTALGEFIYRRARFVSEAISRKLGESCGTLPL